MDEKILEGYIDVCEFIKENEVKIKKIEKKKRIDQDKVRGSTRVGYMKGDPLTWADRLRR